MAVEPVAEEKEERSVSRSYSRTPEPMPAPEEEPTPLPGGESFDGDVVVDVKKAYESDPAAYEHDSQASVEPTHNLQQVADYYDTVIPDAARESVPEEQPVAQEQINVEDLEQLNASNSMQDLAAAPVTDDGASEIFRNAVKEEEF